VRAFDLHAQTLLQTIFSARRDVRGNRFIDEPIEEEVLKKILGIGNDYKLIGYLTMGYVSEFLDEPELLQLGWEEKKTVDEVVEWV
jgi:hypothetical protein